MSTLHLRLFAESITQGLCRWSLLETCIHAYPFPAAIPFNIYVENCSLGRELCTSFVDCWNVSPLRLISDGDLGGYGGFRCDRYISFWSSHFDDWYSYFFIFTKILCTARRYFRCILTARNIFRQAVPAFRLFEACLSVIQPIITRPSGIPSLIHTLNWLPALPRRIERICFQSIPRVYIFSIDFIIILGLLDWFGWQPPLMCLRLLWDWLWRISKWSGMFHIKRRPRTWSLLFLITVSFHIGAIIKLCKWLDMVGK